MIRFPWETCARAAAVSILGVVLAGAGCTTRPPFFPNPDPSMHKTAAQFAADAAHRHYESDAPKAGFADGRVEVDYGIHELKIANSSSQDWDNVEIWLNQKYVVFVPRVPANAASAELIIFQNIYDQDGDYFPLDSSQTPINSIEMFKDGKMYTLNMQLAD
jgi:hypothetical protein